MLGLLGFMAYRGMTDPPTVATNTSMLEKKLLPSELPPLFIPITPNGDAARIYNQLFILYMDHHETFLHDLPPKELADTVVNLLIEAMQHERVKPGFLDDHIPVQPGATPDFAEALEMIPAVALGRAEEHYQEGNVARAVLITRAVWALGQRAFENNMRLYNRSQGLTVMLDAGDRLFHWSGEVDPDSVENVRQWMGVVHEVDKVWRNKYELLSRLKPHIGDLLNIARHDEDPSFRIAAVLKLGQVKFNPGGRGNNRVIMDTIEEAKADPDPLIVQAGIAAASLTPEQLRKLY